MTEAKWLDWPDPYDMLEQCLICELDDRRLRLFACACCRRVWHRLEDDRLRVAIDVAERFADSQATAEELAVARSAAVAFRDAYIWRNWPESLVPDDADVTRLHPDQLEALERAAARRWDAAELQAHKARWAIHHASEAVVAASARPGDDGESYLHHAETVILEASEAQLV